MAPTPAPTAAIYCRISQDRSGDMLGVERQREDCEALCERRGWTVGDVFVDDDRSAYTGKPRPGYERMLEAVKAGRVGAVVAWHPDRLHRSPTELESFIDIINATEVAVATVQAGEYDLASASGRMTARIVGTVARHESEQKSERLRRQREQAAANGAPHGGGRRAFGYEPGGAVVVPEEAQLICEAAGRFLTGESLRGIANDWNDRGVRSSSGGTWSVVSLRTMLTGPRLAGLRVFRGEVVGAGSWPAILSREDHDRIVAMLGNPRVHHRGRPPTSLLGGLLVCGRCGRKMHHSIRSGGGRRYMCAASPGTGGCGRLAIHAEGVEEFVTAAVIDVLDTQALAAAISTPPSAGMTDVTEIEARLAELADLFAAGDITRAEWLRARQGLDERLRAARDAQAQEASAALLAPYVGEGVLRSAWPSMDRDRQRAVLGTVLDEVVVGPARRRGAFDTERIEFRWRY